jgi:hypothetical protein
MVGKRVNDIRAIARQPPVIIEKLCEAVFSVGSAPRMLHKNYNRKCSAESRVEAGSNTSTVALRVVGGDEKGSLEFETINYGPEFHGTRTRK